MTRTTPLVRRLGLAAATTAAVAGLGLGAADLATADDGGEGAAPRGATSAADPVASERDRAVLPTTVVRVRGGVGNGFDVTHYSGRVDHLPTLSEAMAECREYDTRLARVTCWTEVRTHYAGLTEMRRAIAYQRSRH